MSALAVYMGRVYDDLPEMPTQAQRALACVNTVNTKIAKVVTAPIGIPVEKAISTDLSPAFRNECWPPKHAK